MSNGGGGNNKDKTVIGGSLGGVPAPLPGGVAPMPGGKRQAAPNQSTVIGGAMPGPGAPGGFGGGGFGPSGGFGQPQSQGFGGDVDAGDSRDHPSHQRHGGPGDYKYFPSSLVIDLHK